MAAIHGSPAEIRELARYEANRIHGESAAVKRFAGVLYPNCVAPVEFVEYEAPGRLTRSSERG